MEDNNVIYRCFYCNQVLWNGDMQEDGTCPCGSRKLRKAFGITDEELAGLKARGFTPEENQLVTERAKAWID